jgi:hypothetical protein
MTGVVSGLVATGSASVSGCIPAHPAAPMAQPSAAASAVPVPTPGASAMPTALASPSATPAAPSLGSPATGEAAPADPSDPLAEVSAHVLVAGEELTLPTLVGASGGDWGLPSKPGVSLTWAIAPPDRHKARLEGNRLTPLEPGGLHLIATADGRRVWVFHAVQANPGVRAEGGRSAIVARRGSAYPTPMVIQDAATWKRVWEASYIPSDEALATMRSIPTGPPPPPPAPAVDFTQRLLLAADVALMQRGGSSLPVVTHIVGSVVHVATPDVWIADPSPGSAQTATPVMPHGVYACVFNTPVLPAQVTVVAASFRPVDEPAR